MSKPAKKAPAEFIPGPKPKGDGKGVDRAVEALDQKLASFMESNDFKGALQWISKLHRYSFWNRFIIQIEYELRGYQGRVRVAGFKKWKELGRPVKKHSKAIWILAPIFQYLPKRDGDGNVILRKNGKPEMVKAFVKGYRAVPVFAYQDTEGDELPELPEPDWASVEGDGPAGLALLAEQATRLGVPVKFVDSADDPILQGGAGGYYHTVSKDIVVKSDQSDALQAMVLAHELAHHVAHELEREFEWKIGEYPDHEVVAQGVAYLISDRLGFATDDFTLPYIAAWGRDIGRIRRALWFVNKVADGVLPVAAVEAEAEAEAVAA